MILDDTTRAEAFKLAANRTTLVWAFGLTPAATLLIGIPLETVSRSASSIAPADPVFFALNGLAATANPIVQLLLIVGAAVMFAGEYRWQTWRAIVPRATRNALIAGKFLVFAGAAALSILASGAAGFLVGLYSAFVLHLPLVWPGAGALPALLLGFAVSLTQAVVIASFAAVIAVAARSVLAATIGPFIVLIGCELIATRIALPEASAPAAALPNIAAQSLRQLARSFTGDPDAFGLHLVPFGAISLAIWIAILATATFAIFSRQDLAEE